jgi:cyclopropane fatty-acyl-phospholipid synthase-like methyltransferase
MNQSSLERIYPGNDGDEQIAGYETLQLHLERYRFAGKHLIPGTIADIACGAGYGSQLLAKEYGKNIQKIIAVDNNSEAIAYANAHYSNHLIEFLLADAFNFQSPVPLNTIISLETIEHLANPADFVGHLSLQLAGGSRFIASAPVTPSMDANPYHLQDFTSRSFKKLFTDAGLTEINSMIQVQQYNPFKLLGKKQGRSQGLRKRLVSYYLSKPGKLMLRMKSLVSHGFSNRYLVVVFEKK